MPPSMQVHGLSKLVTVTELDLSNNLISSLDPAELPRSLESLQVSSTVAIIQEDPSFSGLTHGRRLTRI